MFNFEEQKLVMCWILDQMGVDKHVCGRSKICILSISSPMLSRLIIIVYLEEGSFVSVELILGFET